MNWTTEEPSMPGIYIAIVKGTGEIVGAAVKAYDYPPGNDLPTGIYCSGYVGAKSRVGAGSPQGVPMAHWFTSWALTMPIHSPNATAMATNPAPETLE